VREFSIVLGQTGPFLATLEISAVLLKYPTLEVVFSCFHGQKSAEIEFLHIVVSALKI
jgi:hypothetical protein